MDELLHHCLRELSFDGDLGCSVSRLRTFITEFYAQHTTHVQNTDDAFCAFIWSLIAKLPTARIGRIPDGAPEVWVAPQTSVKRKAKARGEEPIETKISELIPVHDAKSRTLEDLCNEYGDNLRIAVDPEAIYKAITGSHIRSSKLSPMVYSALQIITRGRDNGVTVIELGQKSKYDQKTCFYLVRQLTELGLVVKVRRGGVGTHFCLHRYFFDRNPFWKAIRDEENNAEQDEQEAVGETTGPESSLGFTPIDARHLSSLPLIRGRVVKLLKSSKNNMHPSNNMLITLGFAHPTKTDRRFFQSRIRELLQEGIIQKVVVPSIKKKSLNTSVKCFRLVTTGQDSPAHAEAILNTQDVEEHIAADELCGLKLNATVHKQIVDLLQDSGTRGMTLNELSLSLCQFDKRTIELLLTRAEKNPPPPHLSDLGIAGLMETSGRERRHRYFTIGAYRDLVAQEKLDKSTAGYADVALTNTGEFFHVDSREFSRDGNMLPSFEGTPGDKQLQSKESGTQLKIPKRKRGKVVNQNEEVEDSSPKRRRIDARHSSEVNSKIMEKPEQLHNVEPVQIAVTTSENRDSAESLGRASKRKLQNHVVKEPQKTNVPKNRGRPPKRRKVDGGSMDAAGVQEQHSIALDVPSPTPENASSKETEGRDPSNIANISSQTPVDKDTIYDSAGNLQPQNVATADINVENANMPSVGSTSSSSATVTNTILPPSFTSKAKINVSHLRRENEMYRVIQDLGGIVNIQTKEFYDAHMALIEKLADIGEPTSCPVGTRTDKRTATATFDAMERRGRIKQLKTSVTTNAGIQRSASIVYLPDIDQQTLNKFLADLARGVPPTPPQRSSYVRISEPLEYGNDLSTSHGTLPLKILQAEQTGNYEVDLLSRNIAATNRLFSNDDSTIRSVLLTEKTTIGQLYGFIVGKVMRARELHLYMLKTFETGTESQNVVSLKSRIIYHPFFLQEIPLGLYCSIVAPLTHDERLSHYYATEEGRRTPIQDIPSGLQNILQIGSSRSRSRFLQILDLLRSLGLVTPLHPLNKGQPWIICEDNGEHPTVFELAATDALSMSVSVSAPTYWHFDNQAPIFLWATSDTQPPLWKVVPTTNTHEAETYWDLLRQACTNSQLATDQNAGDNEKIFKPNTTIARCLRRTVSWNPKYVFTWHQIRYLKQFIDASSRSTPMQIEDSDLREAQIQKICWTSSAPRQSVEDFFTMAHSKLLENFEKSKRTSTRKPSVHKAKRTAELKTSLARKAQEAKLQREQEWEALLSRIHSQPIEASISIRLNRVRDRFLRAGSLKDLHKWEKEVVNTFKEADIASKKFSKFTNKRGPLAKPLPTTPFSSSEPPLHALIESQGQPIDRNHSRNRKRKRSDKDEAKQSVRRHRFHWNSDYDELVRDASAIIRARCRGAARLDWNALEQVFPAVPRNTVRQRLAHLREVPSNEVYLNRLEDRWYDLWIKYRGTEILPDDNPRSASDFDLIKHVEFLRNNIDKNALRVGFSETKEVPTVTIPDSVQQLLSEFDVIETISQTPTWDFVWNATVEEGREQRLLRQVFTRYPEESPIRTDAPPNAISLSEAALKMAMGVPTEFYDPEKASLVLRSVDERALLVASKNLLSRAVLSKSQRDPSKQKPGRQLKISESNLNAIGGSLPRDVFQDANALDEQCLTNDGWREWPLTATDGDSAALVQLVSENKVEFRIDTSQPKAARSDLDWNSKKADDDQIETAIFVQFGQNSQQVPTTCTTEEVGLTTIEPIKASSTSVGEVPAKSVVHGINIYGEPACCSVSSDDGIIDCPLCLDEEWLSISTLLDEQQRELCSKFLAVIRQKGESGITKKGISMIMDLPMEPLSQLIQQLSETNPPLVFWTGYTSLVLVSAHFARDWSVVISKEPMTRISPRRWLDLTGTKLIDFWEAALRAVMGAVIFRPGMTLADLRWRLRSVYDRQEVNDILWYLQHTGNIQMRYDHSITWTHSNPLDDDEEKNTFIFATTDKHWYKV